MSTIEVKTQAELDKAIAASAPGDVIVCLGGTTYKPLVVKGSSRVVARESSRVEARESSSVVARGSSRVVARGSSSVVAGRYVAADGVDDLDAASVRRGQIVIQRFVEQRFAARDGDAVAVAPLLAVHLRRVRHHDDHTAADRGLVLGHLVNGHASRVLRPSCRRECGGGLHSCASPSMAQRYNESATRYVAIECAVSEIVVIDDKVKAPTAKVLYECDRHGDKLPVPS